MNIKESKSKLIAIALTSSLFLGSSGYLYLDNQKIKALNTEQTKEINALEETKKQVQQEIALAQEQIEQYKGKNRELDKLVASASGEIRLQQKKIKSLTAQNGSLRQYKKISTELKNINQKYISRLKELEEKLAALNNENYGLKEENATLKANLEDLEDRNALLEKKIEIASVLKTENIFITGEKKLRSGKYTKSRLHKADRFMVTCDLVENKIAEPGDKIICVRVIDPQGNLIQNGESGNFENGDQNISLPYTQKHVVNYTNKNQKVALPVFLGGKELSKGKYTIEFYCDGYFCGVKKLKLK